MKARKMAGNHSEYAKEMIASGDMEGAIKSLASALQRNNRDVDAWLLLAEMMDDPIRKRDCYQQVLRWSPGNPAALKGLEKLTAPGSAPDEDQLSQNNGARPIAKPSAKVNAQDELFQTLNQKETDELLQIWKENDRSQWPDIALEMIQDILHTRLGNLPSQKRNAFFSDRSVPFRIMRLGVFGFLFLTLGILATIAFLFFIRTQIMWRNLGAPPDKAVRIVDGDYKAVRVQTTSGEIYFCHFESPRECWVKSDQPLEYAYRTKPYDEALVFKTYRKPPALSGALEIKKFYSFIDEYEQVLSVYTLTSQGNVYVWQDGWGTPYDGLIFYCTLPIAVLCGFIFWGWFDLKRLPFSKKSADTAKSEQETFRQKVQHLTQEIQSGQIPAPSPLFRNPLFGLAWLSFVICWFMPQIGKGSPTPEYAMTEYGLHLALNALTSLPALLITLIYSLITLNLSQLFSYPLSLAITMSALLFMAAPLFLLWSRPSPRKIHTAWLIYALLNLICVILFFSIIFTTPILGHMDPNNLSTQLLPGFIVWTGAQILLTIAALTKL